MVILYSCDFCEKEFNLQIKLKKHNQADHSGPKELDPSEPSQNIKKLGTNIKRENFEQKD